MQRPSLPTREAGTSGSVDRREWGAKRDWLRVTSGVLGDTAIKDDINELLASSVKPETQDGLGAHGQARFGRELPH